jgi:hypothetical protein
MLGSPQILRTSSIPIVYKFLKVLYRLKQAPQAWYARLKTFLLEHGYGMRSVDKTLFTFK